jgi:putative peptidoglycan lipid II flippase
MLWRRFCAFCGELVRRFLGAGAWLFGGIMLGRILGLVRDLTISNMFGSTVNADRAVFVVTIPDVMINVLIGGAMGAALIPEFKRRNDAENWALFRQASGLVFGAMLLVTGVLAVMAEPITRTLVSGLPADAIPGTARLIQICLWAVPITASSAVARSMLQGHERFGVPAMAGFFYNLVVVLGLFYAGNQSNLRWLAIAAVVGAGLSLGMQWIDVRRYRSSERVQGWVIDSRLVGRFFGALLAGSMILIVPVAMRGFASTNGVGGQTMIYLASKLVELPMGTMLSIVSIAMFPAIAAALARDDGRDEATLYARQGLGVILTLAVPIALGLGYFSGYFADLLYRHGEMTEASAAQIAQLSAIMMIGLVPQALNTMLLSIFNGLRDMVTPFIISFVGLVGVLILGFAGVTELVSLSWIYVGFHWVVTVSLLVGVGMKHGLWLVDGSFAKRALIRVAASGLVFAALYPILWIAARDSGRPLIGVVMGLVCGGVALVAGLLVDREVMAQLKGVISRKMGKKS